ncbi:Cell division control protein Cdc25 [Mycena chlorophos]|uniref:Cell division control protein Cdc25 n=1 Tax=Mycena chlorophos TaxID=658473 RepID=A0A8H6RXQ2_MYCCL|nr:Cell division control protein Cdc25 [Mycena chlorophos]
MSTLSGSDRNRRIQRKLGATDDDDTTSVHSDCADAPFSPTLSDASPSADGSTDAEQQYPSLQPQLRLLREYTGPDQPLDPEPLSAVVHIFVATVDGIVASLHQKHILLRTCVEPMLRQATELARADLIRVLELAQQVMETLFLLQSAAKELHERMLVFLASKPLPPLPAEESDDSSASSSPSESTRSSSVPSQGGPTSGNATDGDESDDDVLADLPAAAVAVKPQKKKFAFLRRRAPASEASAVQARHVTPTVKDDMALSFRRSCLYDCKDPSPEQPKGEVPVMMPLPNIGLMIDPSNQVLAASLDALVLLMTSYQVQDPESMAATFLLSFRFFCTAEELIDAIEARWNATPPEYALPLDAAQQRVWDHHMRYVHENLSRFVVTWIADYWHPESDTLVVPRLRAFIRRLDPVLRNKAKVALKGVQGQTELSRVMAARIAAFERPRPPPVVVRPFQPTLRPETNYRMSLNQFIADPAGMEWLATQLTAIMNDWVLCMEPEIAMGEWMFKPLAEQGLGAYKIENFETYFVHWIAEGILIETERVDRVKQMEFWLEFALFAIELRNFCMSFCVYKALLHPGVRRLWHSILDVSVAHKQMFLKLDYIFNGDNNFAVYREALAAHPDLPTIPLMCILRDDTEYIRHVTRLFFSNGEGNALLINLNAVYQINAIIQYMESCFFQYNIEVDHEFWELAPDKIRNETSGFTEKECLERSHEIEPSHSQPNQQALVDGLLLWFFVVDWDGEPSAETPFSLRHLPAPQPTPTPAPPPSVKPKKSLADSFKLSRFGFGLRKKNAVVA